MASVKKPKRRRTSTYIKAWRDFRNLTQDRVSERIGISRENYGRIENGKVPYNQDFLELCSLALNCTVADLLERDPRVEGMIDKLRRLMKDASPKDQNLIFEMAKTYLENKG